jgi:hypothetical protein
MKQDAPVPRRSLCASRADVSDANVCGTVVGDGIVELGMFVQAVMMARIKTFVGLSTLITTV